MLREAASDASWLLNRGYAVGASLKLVGDRFQLVARQRGALLRTVCTDASLAHRCARRVAVAELAGRPLRLDGFNVLMTIEAALGGAIVVRGRDGCYRDLSGVHGSYRQIDETRPAVRLVGAVLAKASVGPCVWHFDRPVSNSGRLRALLLETAAREGWDWSVELPFNPDAELRLPGPCVATADGAILDAVPCWANLVREVVEAHVPTAWVVTLFPDP